jgi:hypothetical protein
LPEVCGRQYPCLTETAAEFLEVAAVIVQDGDDRLAERTALVPRPRHPRQISEREVFAAQSVYRTDQAKAPAAARSSPLCQFLPSSKNSSRRTRFSQARLISSVDGRGLGVPSNGIGWASLRLGHPRTGPEVHKPLACLFSGKVRPLRIAFVTGPESEVIEFLQSERI